METPERASLSWVPMTSKLRRACSLLFVSVALVMGARADILHMKDGRQVEGKILSETSKLVRIKTRLGELEFPASDIERIERKKSPLEEFEERWDAAKTADEFFAVGQWADQAKMRKQARKAMKKAVSLDPGHAGANTWLGLVEYKGEWMKPEERDRRMAADQDASMRARGLVLYGERWVTPEERDKLEAGLVLHEGEWVPFAEAQRAKGLEEFRGEWISRAEAIARQGAAEAELRADERFQVVVNAEALLAGPLPAEDLSRIGEGVVRGRAWYQSLMGGEPGLGLLGDRLAEFYVFPRGSAAYEATVEYFSTLSPTLPEGWAPVAKTAFGFWWVDPSALSSANQGHRGADGLDGHCFHHWGHMLLNRTGYEGRLLPPWYDEAFASLCEFEVHGRNAVFCRAQTSISTGTNATRLALGFDPKLVREGRWREVLKTSLEANRVLSIQKLAQLDFSELTVLDIATGMGILEWLASFGEEALPKFHAALRAAAPEAPLRVIPSAGDRGAAYDRAFTAVTGSGWRDADRAWREWFLAR